MKKMEQTGKNVSPYSNEARNRYVVEGITNSMLKFLKDRPIAEISISEICQDAAVGRTSFYRNFETKEDIIKNHIRTLMTRWQEAYEADSRGSNAELYGSLFAYLKEYDDFFLLLKKRGLLYLFLEVYKERNGASAEDDNMWAYTKSFIAYGTYGWIEEWINRGMQESAEGMAKMLSEHGMK